MQANEVYSVIHWIAHHTIQLKIPLPLILNSITCPTTDIPEENN